MIVSIAHKGLQLFWEANDPRLLPSPYIEKIRVALYRLNSIDNIQEMKLTGRYRLHPLRGNYDDYWSINITKNYRMIFKFIDQNVHLLNFLDYH